MPLTSFAVAFSLGRGSAHSEPTPRPQPAAVAADHSTGDLRSFSEAMRLGGAADHTPVRVATRPKDNEPARPVVVPEWLADSVKLRTHGGSESLTGPPAPEPKTDPTSESSLSGDAHGPAQEHAMGELAAPDRPRDIARSSQESKSDVDLQARIPPATRTSAAPGTTPQGVAHAPAEGPGARSPATFWTIRTNDGLAYQGPDKAALEIWAAARNAELARVQMQWSYPASYQPWTGYGYASGGCAGGSCR